MMQVLDGPGQNVVIKSEVEDHPVPNETEWQDLPKVSHHSCARTRMFVRTYVRVMLSCVTPARLSLGP